MLADGHRKISADDLMSMLRTVADACKPGTPLTLENASELRNLAMDVVMRLPVRDLSTEHVHEMFEIFRGEPQNGEVQQAIQGRMDRRAQAVLLAKKFSAVSNA